jgi:hypothetical protein
VPHTTPAREQLEPAAAVVCMGANRAPIPRGQDDAPDCEPLTGLGLDVVDTAAPPYQRLRLVPQNWGS